MLIYFVSIFFIGDIDKSYGQQSVTDWKQHALPKEEDSISKYNNSVVSWLVSINTTGQVTAENKVAKFPSVDTLPFIPVFKTNEAYRFRGFRTVKKVSDGYLLGFNKGEFGGSLHWFSFNGDSTYQISNGLVNYIFEHKSKIYIAHGLAHMGSDDGGINQMLLTNGKWTIGTGADLTYNPEVFLPIKNGVIIVTSKTVLLFDGLQKIKKIKKDGFWEVLYPQSAVLQNNDLYIGMRGGIYKINLKSRKEEWLMPY